MDTLYHYCSTAAFELIVSSGTIRLSSLSLSNDSDEGQQVRWAVQRLALRDRLGKSATGLIARGLERVEWRLDGLGFCLSEDGDLLSQWRGYADDGRGVAIGFSRSYLEAVCKSMRANNATEGDYPCLVKVQYERAEHEDAVRPLYSALKAQAESGSGFFKNLAKVKNDVTAYYAGDLYDEVAKAGLLEGRYALKSSAFREEKEWRILANADESSVHGYRATSDRLVPYRNLPLQQLAQPSIVRLVLGPKHLTPIEIVNDFLTRHGHLSVVFRVSAASYR